MSSKIAIGENLYSLASYIVSMPTYLVLVDVESPEPLLVKVRAASHNDAELLAMRGLQIESKSRIIATWDINDIQDVAELLPKRARRTIPRRRPDNDVPVRSHVRRRAK